MTEMESQMSTKRFEEMEKKVGVDKRDIGPPPCGPYGKPLILLNIRIVVPLLLA